MSEEYNQGSGGGAAPPAPQPGPPVSTLNRYQAILSNIRSLEDQSRDIVNNDLYIAQRTGDTEEERMAMIRINRLQRTIRSLESRLHREEDRFGPGEGRREEKR